MALLTKIKEYREKTGMKQAELAELVNARRETIVHLENGKYNPSLKLAMDIAKVFGVTVEDIFEFTDFQSQNTNLRIWLEEKTDPGTGEKYFMEGHVKKYDQRKTKDCQ